MNTKPTQNGGKWNTSPRLSKNQKIKVFCNFSQ